MKINKKEAGIGPFKNILNIFDANQVIKISPAFQ